MSRWETFRPDEITTYPAGVAVEWRSPRDGWQPGIIVQAPTADRRATTVVDWRPTTEDPGAAAAAHVYVRHTGATLDPDTELYCHGPLSRLELTPPRVRPVAWSACNKCGNPITDPDNVPCDDSAQCTDCGDPT